MNPFWDEDEYLDTPLFLEDIWGIDNAPTPDERFSPLDEVWVLMPDGIAEWGIASGRYMWRGDMFDVEVEIDGVSDWYDEKQVWLCGEIE